MKDPFYNPTRWIKPFRKKPKTSRYYFSHIREELRMLSNWNKIKNDFFTKPITNT